MSLTILEVLRNAEYNLKHAVHPAQAKMGMDQLSNAIFLLDDLDKDILDEFNETDLEHKPVTKS